jgi:ribose 5-phosphate isomerase A
MNQGLSIVIDSENERDYLRVEAGDARTGNQTMADQDFERQKRQAAAAAAASIHNGIRLGLGSGSTVFLIVAALGERRKAGDLDDLVVVAASSRTEAALQTAGIPISTLDDYPRLDLAIDGADEVDPGLALIKGGGGAMLRERLVLAAADERMIIVDTSKLVPVLGTRWAVPVEVTRFGWRVAERALIGLGAKPTMRRAGEQPFITDEGNYVLDCWFGQIPEPAALAGRISGLPGVMAHGIFVDFADRVLIAGPTGIETRLKSNG